MADSFAPTIAPQTDGSGNPPEQVQQEPDATEPVPITEQEVGEYREQDRYLPVSPATPTLPLFHRMSSVTPHSFSPNPLLFLLTAFWPWPPLPPPPPKNQHNTKQKRTRMYEKNIDRECFAYHEERRAADGENC